MSPTRYRCAKSLVAHTALVAQWIAHWTSNPEVAGSSPVKSVETFSNQMPNAAVAQWLVHLPCKQKVTSSNLVSG